jgi:hypothetical protein
MLGQVGMRLVEQQDPLWLRMAAAQPTDALAPPWLIRPHADAPAPAGAPRGRGVETVPAGAARASA